MPNGLASISIGLLADHPAALPRLQRWFEDEWASYYGPSGSADAAADLRSFANRSTLPVGLVALLDGEVCGVAALKAESIASHEHLTPWAAAGFVDPRRRGRGIGNQLLAALEHLGCALGYPTIYCATGTSASLLRRRGWRLLERVAHDGEHLAIHCRSVEAVVKTSA